MENESNAASSLPRPTVKYITNPDDISEATARGMMSNPVYVGVPPYRRIVSDEAWIRAAIKLIEDEGAEQFLVNMLYMLRTSIIDAVPDEAIPDDYDGPWPDDEEEDWGDQADWPELQLPPSPWRYPMEGFIFCSHDDLPMILVDEEFVCVSEYLLAHVGDSVVTDLITEPILTLIFQNGHTLPLFCPDCGESLHDVDHNDLLDEINGLTIVGIEWEFDTEELFLEFDDPGVGPVDDLLQETPAMLAVHLNSVRELTCPYNNLSHAGGLEA